MSTTVALAILIALGVMSLGYALGWSSRGESSEQPRTEEKAEEKWQPTIESEADKAISDFERELGDAILERLFAITQSRNPGGYPEVKTEEARAFCDAIRPAIETVIASAPQPGAALSVSTPEKGAAE